MIFLVAVTCSAMAVFFVIVMVIYFRKKRDQNIFRRMRRHNVTEKSSPKILGETFLQTFYRLVRNTSKPLENKNFSSKLDLKLKQAGIPLFGIEFVVANLIVSVIIGTLIYMLTINHILAILTALFVPLGIWMAILVMIRKRKNSFTEQLGDCLITVANALRAGYSFQQAMEVIANEMESPISQEFARLTTDLRMGIPLEVALKQMDERVDSSDFTLVVTAVLIHREVGGNLAQILDTISDTIMERIRMKREINALTAQGRLSAIVLLLLPFAVGVFMYFVNPSQMNVFFEDPVGQIVLAISLIMDAVGFMIIRRIVDIEI